MTVPVTVEAVVVLDISEGATISVPEDYTVGLSRPRPEVLDGSWKFPAIEPA